MSSPADQSDKNAVRTKRSKGTGKPRVSRIQLRSHFLNRLEWYVDLRERCKKDPGCEEWKMKAVDWAIYSTFRDCEEQGIVNKAKALLDIDNKTE